VALATNLGFPRIGSGRELAWALERHWAGTADPGELDAVARELRRRHWQLQRAAGIGHVPTGDFSLYDHVLDTALMVGAVPERFRAHGADPAARGTRFALARGARVAGAEVPPLATSPWFDTAYHHLVPEVERGQRFARSTTDAVDHFTEAAAAGVPGRPVLLGPVSFLLLADGPGGTAERLELLPALLEVYAQVLDELARAGASWVQLDEPCLATDLAGEAHVAFMIAYHRLARAADVRLLLASYFSGLRDNLGTALRLPVAALHLDLVSEPGQLGPALNMVPDRMALSLGVVDGRNVWRTDLDAALRLLEQAAERIGPDRIMVAPSCSLLHVPVDAELETGLDPQLRRWLAFAVQKLREVAVLAAGIDRGRAAVAAELEDAAAALASRRRATATGGTVAERLARLGPADFRRASPAPLRRAVQARVLGLPPLPAAAVGDFPQSAQVGAARSAHRRGELDRRGYESVVWGEVDRALRLQSEAGLDVLVHGGMERDDAVEQLAERLDGVTLTRAGWVQVAGHRCARPPLIHGDVTRTGPVTVEWARAAQARTGRPVKAVLPGPVTLLRRSFARDDQPAGATCAQLALAVRDEVVDLERAGLRVVQLDEPALPAGLPAHRADGDAYLDWAVGCFRLASCGVSDRTQVHAHVCHAGTRAWSRWTPGDTLEVLAALDADVLSLGAGGQGAHLLDALGDGEWPTQLGPGLWDVRAPAVPGVADLVVRLRRALAVLGPERLWVTPGCGLATRRWEEVGPALANLARAAATVRAELAGDGAAQAGTRADGGPATGAQEAGAAR
jgi:5-methyltetrahydropteroyltriglutamate--homocysteine methyltransferase